MLDLNSTMASTWGHDGIVLVPRPENTFKTCPRKPRVIDLRPARCLKKNIDTRRDGTERISCGLYLLLAPSPCEAQMREAMVKLVSSL